MSEKAVGEKDPLGELVNLRRVAEQHRDDCRREDCGVSMWVLRQTAERLVDAMPWADRAKAMEQLKGWPL